MPKLLVHSLQLLLRPLAVVLCFVGFAHSQTITLGAFTPVLCQGNPQNLTLPITKTGTFVGNQFRAEISQPSPTFGYSPPTLSGLGSVAGSSGTIPLLVPGTTPAGIYKVRVVHVSSGTASNEANLTITPPYVITLGIAGSFCGTDTTTFSINIGPAPYYTAISLANSTKRWYRNGVLIPGQTGSTLRVLPNQYRAGDHIYAELRTNTGCFGGAAATFVSSEKDTLGGIALDSLTNRRVCAGQTIPIVYKTQRLASGGSLQLVLSDTLGRFTQPTLTQPLAASPTSFVIPATLVGKPSYRYQIRIEYAGAPAATCDKSNAIPIQVTQNITSAAIASTGDTVCVGSSLSFTGSSLGFTGPNYTWLRNSTAIGNGNTLSFNGFVNGDTLRLSVTGNTACGTRTTVSPFRIIRVVPLAPLPIASNDSVCGSGSVSLRAAPLPPGFQYRWYNLLGGLLGTSNSYTTPNLTATTRYVLNIWNGFCDGPSLNLVAKVNPIPAKPAILGFTQADTTLCNGESITLQAPAGHTRYQWSTGATTASIQVAAAGRYAVQVGDLGCLSPTSDSVTVIVRPVIAAPVVVQTNTVCADGPADLAIQNPQAGVIYNWYSGTLPLGNLLGTGTSLTVGGVTTIQQVVVYALSGRCQIAPVSLPITRFPRPTKPTITSSSSVICYNGSVSLSAPFGYQKYIWNTGSTDSVLTVTQPGKYVLTVATSTCASDPSDTVVVIASALQTVSTSGSRTSATLQENPFALVANPSGGVWTGVGVSISGVFDPIAAGLGLHKLVYTKQDGNCEAKDSVMMTVTEGQVLVNNTLTPNGDGYNDVWEPTPLTKVYPNTEVAVWNRYGVQVYQNSNYTTPWDAKVSGALLPAGSYYYQLRFADGRRFTGYLEIAY